MMKKIPYKRGADGVATRGKTKAEEPVMATRKTASKSMSTRKGSTPAKSVAAFKKAARQEKRAAKDMSRASYDAKHGRSGKAAENKRYAKEQEKRAGHNIAKALHRATKPVRKKS